MVDSDQKVRLTMESPDSSPELVCCSSIGDLPHTVPSTLLLNILGFMTWPRVGAPALPPYLPCGHQTAGQGQERGMLVSFKSLLSRSVSPLCDIGHYLIISNGKEGWEVSSLWAAK